MRRVAKTYITVALLGGSLLVACGQTPPEEGAVEYDLAMVEACMREQGLNPDQTPEQENPDSFDSDEQVAWLQVRASCIRDAGGEFWFDDPEQLAEHDRLTWELTECIREAGWDMDDPEPGSFGQLMPASLDQPSDPTDRERMMEDIDRCSVSTGWGSGSDGPND